MFVPFKLTEDGFESHFACNHIGHFVMTMQLLPVMKQHAPGRIISLSSAAHESGKIDFNHLTYEKRNYGKGYEAYSNSKLANLLFARLLNAKLEKSNINIKAFAVHPGVIKTELGRDSAMLTGALYTALFFMLKDVPQGAATTLYAAVSPDLEDKGGNYLEDCAVSKSKNQQVNDECAEELWQYSEQKTKIIYPF